MPKAERKPGSRCTICAHAQRSLIDLTIASGAHAVDVAKTYSLGRMSVTRHRENCLTAKLARAGAERAERKSATAIVEAVEKAQREEQVNAATILDGFLSMHAEISDLYERAQREETASAAARVFREKRENWTALGKLIGAFPKETATTTIDNRTQIVAMNELTPAELRAIISCVPSMIANKQHGGDNA